MPYESPVFVTIEVEQGASYSADAILYLDDAPAAIADYDLTWTCKRSARLSASKTIFSKSTDAAAEIVADGQVANKAQLNLLPSDTAKLVPGEEYVWDVVAVHKNTGAVYYPYKGTITASLPVTRVS
jgi:hypothetical protein